MRISTTPFYLANSIPGLHPVMHHLKLDRDVPEAALAAH
jgi:hypothetical protein